MNTQNIRYPRAVTDEERREIRHNWKKIHEIIINDSEVEGTLIEVVNGGWSVVLGKIKAFLPSSKLFLKPVHKDSLFQYLNQTFTFKIISFKEKRGKYYSLVLSRESILRQEFLLLRETTINAIKNGRVEFKGTISNIMDYGLFIDLGGVDGLLHKTKMNESSKIYKKGDLLKVAVHSFNDEDPQKKINLCLIE